MMPRARPPRLFISTNTAGSTEMPLEITFTLEEQDLEHFRGIMESAHQRAEALPEA